jgi:hypothetical protein
MRAKLHFNMRKEIAVQLDNEHWYDHYQIQSRQIMKIRLPYYGINYCQRTETLLRNTRRTP